MSNMSSVSNSQVDHLTQMHVRPNFETYHWARNIAVVYVSIVVAMSMMYTSIEVSAQQDSRAVSSDESALPQPTTITETSKIAKTASFTNPNERLPAQQFPPSSWRTRWLPSDPNETRKIILTAIVTALVTLIAVFFKKISSASISATSWLWKRLRIEKTIESMYRKKLARELRAIQLFDMSEAKDLETFYIPLRLTNWVSPDLQKNDFRASNGHLHLSAVLDQYERITIVGNPGAGKTTITRHAAAALADSKSRINGKRYFPVYIQLSRLKDFLDSVDYKSKSLIQLASEILKLHGFPEPERYLKRRLDAGECLVVLDGFDEIADREGAIQQRFASKVRDLIASIGEGNRIVMTTRSAGYMPAWFTGFCVFEMGELSLGQAKQFVDGWFRDEPKTQSLGLQKVLEENDRLQLLVTSPLMLAIVCFVYGNKPVEDEFLPRRRVDLYERCIVALIVKWDESRGIKREAKFTAKEIEDVLSYVAYDALIEEKIDFTDKDLRALVRSHLPKAGIRQYEDDEFILEVLKHTGLFKKKADDTIGFLHLTFQEYLAAKIIEKKVWEGVEKKDVRSQIGDIIVNAINPVWTEPIALAAGIMRGKKELVTVLYEEFKANPRPELKMLLALCLRDADLDDFTFDQDYLIKYDEILGKLVESATEATN